MSIIYSLVCWGGLTGKAVSLSASTDVATLTNHGLRTGAKLWPSGAIPTELSSATPVYARVTGTNTLTLHASANGAAEGTGQITFAGSSTYTVTLKSDLVASPATALAPFGLSDLSRWSGRVYDSVRNFVAARNPVTSGFDIETCEIGEAFIEYSGGSLGTSLVNAPQTVVVTAINGVLTPGFHFGDDQAGYEILVNSTIAPSSGINNVVAGVTVRLGASATRGFNVASLNARFTNNLVVGINSSTASGLVIGSAANACLIAYNRVRDFSVGIQNEGAQHSTIANNTVSGCGTGFYPSSGASSYRYGYWLNNVSVGNTTNWFAQPTSLQGADKNAGESGDTPWTTAGKTNITVTPSDFVAYPSNLRLSATSLLIDAGVEYYGRPEADVRMAEAPNYNNGSAEHIDVGAYEFDHGYGNHPASTTVSFSGINADSEIRVYNNAGAELAGVEGCVADQSLSWVVPTPATVRIVIVHPDYKIKEFTYTSAVGNQSIPVQQEPDKWYSNPA